MAAHLALAFWCALGVLLDNGVRVGLVLGDPQCSFLRSVATVAWQHRLRSTPLEDNLGVVTVALPHDALIAAVLQARLLALLQLVRDAAGLHRLPDAANGINLHRAGFLHASRGISSRYLRVP